MRRLIFALLLLSPLAACGRTAVDAPGLGPRPIEGRPILAPDAAAEAEAPATPGLAERLDAIVQDATAAHARFESARQGGAAAIARGRGTPEGSEAWIAREQALSARAAQAGALRDTAGQIDALRIDPAYAGAADRAAIEAAGARIEALAAAERDADAS